MQYFQHQDNIFHLLEAPNRFVQLSGAFGRPIVELPLSKVKQVKGSHANAAINQFYKNNKEPDWVFEGEKFRRLDFLESEAEYQALPMHIEGDNPTWREHFRFVYHQGAVWRSVKYQKCVWLFKNGKLVKKTSLGNCAGVFNITTKTII